MPRALCSDDDTRIDAEKRGALMEKLDELRASHGWVELLFVLRTLAEDDDNDELVEVFDHASEFVD